MRKKRYKKGVPYSLGATRICLGINRKIMNIPMTGDVCNLNYNIALNRLFCAIIAAICAYIGCFGVKLWDNVEAVSVVKSDKNL